MAGAARARYNRDMVDASMPWSLKGISDEARVYAREAAGAADIPIGDWLSAVINAAALQEQSASTPAATPATDSPAADDRPLGRNEIRELQRLLNSLDFDAGPADGQIGPKTTSAITLYQKFAGFEPDGKATRELLIDLRAVARDVPNRR